MAFLKRIDQTSWVLRAALFLGATLALGCQSSTVTHDQAQSVLESRIGIRQQLGLTKSQLDISTAALNDINGKQADDLVASFLKFGEQIDMLDSSIGDLNRASAASKEEAQTYFDTAAVKIALINDADLKARATSRREKAQELADQIEEDTKVLQEAYRLFVQKLRDVQAYLAADLTSGCVRSIQDEFDQTNNDVAPIKAKSDHLSHDLEIADELMNTGEIKPATTTSPSTTSPSTTNLGAWDATLPVTTTESSTSAPAAMPSR